MGGTLHISAQNATNFCLVGKNAGGAYALTTSQPIHITCDSGAAIKPTPALSTTSSVLYLFGNANGPNIQTVVEGCFIGDPSSAGRFGLHGIVFDTTVAGAFFRAPIVRNVFIQAGTSGNGYGIAVSNHVSNNVNGGTYGAIFGEGSTIQGGVELFGAGDSITIKGIVPDNGAVGADNNGILVNLAAGAGNTTLDGVNFSQAHGVKVDCAYNFLISGGEYEGQATLAGNALVDFNAGACTTSSVKIRNAQFQYAAGFGTHHCCFGSQITLLMSLWTVTHSQHQRAIPASRTPAPLFSLGLTIGRHLSPTSQAPPRQTPTEAAKREDQNSVPGRGGPASKQYLLGMASQGGGARCPMLKTLLNVLACLKNARNKRRTRFPASTTEKWQPTTDL
jgi:hypothetical protein